MLRNLSNIKLPIYFCQFMFIAILVSGIFSSPVRSETQVSNKTQILVLNSYHQTFHWTDDIVTAIIKTFAANHMNIEFHVEYMDSKRKLDPMFEELWVKMLLTEYSSQHLDLVITSDDHAFMFVKKYHDQLFDGVPVVFCGVNNVEEALEVDRHYFTGIVELLDIEDNIRLANRMFPHTENIVIVSDGTPTGIGTRKMARDAAEQFTDKTFTYLNGEDLSTDDMLEHLKNLAANSVVIAPAWYRDKNDNTFDNTTIYPKIADASSVPVFSTSSANIGLGLIGGKVNSGTIQGKTAAKMGIQILRQGVLPRNIPIETRSRNPYIFDYRQLERFKINEKILPVSSTILYQPFSFFKTYRLLVISVVIVFCLLVFLTSYLLINTGRLREARNKLSRSRENLRVTLQSIADAVITTDISGRITHMNRVAETLTGWKENEAQGKPLEEIFVIIRSQPDSTPCESPVSIVLKQGTMTKLQSDTVLISRTKKEFRIADSCAPIRNDKKEILGAVLVFRDISSEYQREIQLQQSRKMEAVGRLAGGIAHDFNNMLSGIMGASSVLSMEFTGNHKAEKFIDIIIQSSERAASLVRNLLTFSRKQDTTHSAVNVHEIIAATNELLKNTLDRRIELSLDLRADTYVVMGDSSQLQSAIINLCINASHAIPAEGKITIATHDRRLSSADCERIAREMVPGHYVEIEIRDTGVGIPHENIERIFDPFFTTKPQGEGTGLGLATVFGAIKQHKGHISVESDVGAGTVFRILLPKTDDGDVSAEHAVDIAMGTGTILLVDDEDTLREIGSEILRRMGYQVDTAENGVRALERFSLDPRRYDAVLLDMIMPEMNGYDCFFKMKEINPDVRVILISGYWEDSQISAMKADGIVDVITKPYQYGVFSQVIARATSKKK